MVFLALLELSLLLTKNSSKCRRHVAGDCFKLSTISRVFYLTGNSWRCVYISNCVLIETENWEEALFLKMLFSKKSPPIGIFCDASVLKWLKSTRRRKKVEMQNKLQIRRQTFQKRKLKVHKSDLTCILRYKITPCFSTQRLCWESSSRIASSE